MIFPRPIFSIVPNKLQIHNTTHSPFIHCSIYIFFHTSPTLNMSYRDIGDPTRPSPSLNRQSPRSTLVVMAGLLFAVFQTNHGARYRNSRHSRYVLALYNAFILVPNTVSTCPGGKLGDPGLTSPDSGGCHFHEIHALPTQRTAGSDNDEFIVPARRCTRTRLRSWLYFTLAENRTSRGEW